MHLLGDLTKDVNWTDCYNNANKEYIDAFINAHKYNIGGSIIPELIGNIYDSKERLEALQAILKELYYCSAASSGSIGQYGFWYNRNMKQQSTDILSPNFVFFFISMSINNYYSPDVKPSYHGFCFNLRLPFNAVLGLGNKSPSRLSTLYLQNQDLPL